MQIGLLTTSYPRHPRDAAGRFVAELAGWLAEQGDELEVLAPAPARSEHLAVHVRPLASAWLAEPRLFYGAGAPDNLRDPRAWLQIPGYLARLSAATWWHSRHWERVLSHWLLPCSLVAARCSRARPHLAIAHSSDVHLLARLGPLVGSRLLAQALGRPRSGLVLTSEALRPLLLPLARAPLVERRLAEAEVIRMGIAMSRFALGEAQQREAQREAHALADKIVVLFVGRLVPVKGLAHLLAACASLPEAALVIVGDGPERTRLAALAEALRMDVRFTGEQSSSEVQAWMQTADIFALPSVLLPDGRTESAPVVLLEALAAGLPVVATRVGGNAELITEGVSGLLVPPGEVTPLRAALATLAADPALRARLGQAGRTAAAAHSWDIVGARLRQQLLAL